MKSKAKLAKSLKIVVIILIVFSIALGAFAVGLACYVHFAYDDNIISMSNLSNIKDVDYIIVLGCRVKPGGIPSDMLYDRVYQGVEVYNRLGNTPILLSGDHKEDDYNETSAMRNVAIELGANINDLVLDGYGLSTYDSMWRAKNLFGAKKVIIVTQEYHLYRALFIANSMGLEAYGVSASIRNYGGQIVRDFRELFACDKDFFTVNGKYDPKHKEYKE